MTFRFCPVPKQTARIQQNFLPKNSEVFNPENMAEYEYTTQRGDNIARNESIFFVSLRPRINMKFGQKQKSVYLHF